MKLSLTKKIEIKNIVNFFVRIKYTLRRLLINSGYFIYVNKKYHEYDKNIFCNGSSSNFRLIFRQMDKEQLKAFLTYNYHKIEKGLSLREIKPNFASKTNVISTIIKSSEYYISKFGTRDSIIISIYHALNDYYNWHKKNNIQIKVTEVENYLNKYKFLNEEKKYQKYGGSIILKKKDTLKKMNSSYEGFFNSRRSVRIFSNKIVENSLIIDCIQKSLNGTPSVCNRDINRVYIINDSIKRKLILSLQNGNSGFGIDASKLLIVTSKLNCFFHPSERRAPYIAGGLFAMSLLYSLHSASVASCCLNWDVSPEKDIKLKRILKIKDETIIMLIAVGHYAEKYKVAVSKKNQCQNIVSFI